MGNIDFAKYDDLIASSHLSRDTGKVTEVTGMLIKGTLPGAAVGSIVHIHPAGLEKAYLAEVVGFKDKHVLMMPLTEMRGIGLGSKIILTRQ
ncbi:MAG TPA: flagellum-specific ATP synthase FliI, partial [Pseudobdellovibrionaceae bacterium]|nr:flagellum-specific ATP synthase FliI [Pseudobdellovibrionaceae bacterium]